MRIEKIKDKNVWEGFLLGTEEKSFLQSWCWGEFNQKIGHKIWRLGVYNSQELIAAALVIKIKAKRGTFLFVPHGPLLGQGFLLRSPSFGGQVGGQALLRSGNPKSQIPNPKQIPNSKSQILNILLEELKKLAGQEKASFIRVAPIWERNERNVSIFRDLGFRQAPIHMHPELTWQLDISPGEQELLMGMRKTTRYLIKQADKNQEIEVVQSQNIEDLEAFSQIYQQTAQRHHFVPFSFDYVRKEFETFLSDNQIVLFLGKHQDQVLVASIVVFWQGIAFYHHSASLPTKIPVSYAVQWEIIKKAKGKGCRVYNFWGIAEEKLKVKKGKHPWWGLTLFKRGFGGQEKAYVKTQDYVVAPQYWLNFIIETIRKKRRRL